ncbi:unnamed protein product [Mytilus edulis]|uniref:Mutator-like transposase domain-containing protein n=1 Tax=Mytilus edulis TaxID=6550 RepID=A0A8S3Q046_MYTED|nr:unnamed protein product [Mytilus edulis]
MEPDMVVEMIKDLDSRGVKIKELAGDDDSTGFNRAVTLLPHSNIVKSSDRNHVMNQGNSEGIENGVRCTIDHMYRQHTKCDVKWCGYLKDPTTYRHSNLPYGKNLSSLALKNDFIERLFLKDIEQNQKNYPIWQVHNLMKVSISPYQLKLKI